MAEWQTRVKNAWSALWGSLPNAGAPGSRAVNDVPVLRPSPQALRAYYDNDGLYYQVQTALHLNDISTEAMLPIRNPAHASVEFFAATLWGDLNIVTPSQKVIDSVKQFWGWSNWESKKAIWARWGAIYGEIFAKVASSAGRVLMQLLPNENIGDNFEVNERGELTYARIDTPLAEGWINTEVWDLLSYRQWKHQLGADVAVGRLGSPLVEITLAEMGINFIPIVQAKFLDTGERHGVGSYFHALDPIDEANRMATRLHQILFAYNRPLYVVTQAGTDKTGRPLPPVKVTDGDTIDLGKDKLLSLPGGADIKLPIPDIKYGDALAILNAHLQYIQDEYLPELGWYHNKASANTSGRALRIALTAAIARCEEARANMDRALVRANMMALEIGRVGGIFSGIGAMELGSFEHDLAKRSVIPEDGYDQAQTAKEWVQAGVPADLAAQWAGRSEDEVAELASRKVNPRPATQAVNQEQR